MDPGQSIAYISGATTCTYWKTAPNRTQISAHKDSSLFLLPALALQPSFSTFPLQQNDGCGTLGDWNATQLKQRRFFPCLPVCRLQPKHLSGYLADYHSSVIFGIAGTAGLILLSIFDTLRYPHLHDGFLLLFMYDSQSLSVMLVNSKLIHGMSSVGYVLAAIFLCAEYQRLGIHFRNRRVLRLSFWGKLTFIILEGKPLCSLRSQS